MPTITVFHFAEEHNEYSVTVVQFRYVAWLT